MFEFVDLSKKLPKAEYKRRYRTLGGRLLDLQRAAWQQGLASLVLFEGLAGAGRVGTVRKLTQLLEPRGFRVHATLEPRSFEAYLPWMWRFWVRVPSYGRMAIFDRSWYGRCWHERFDGDLSDLRWKQRTLDITDFERTLVRDRYEVVKLFFHMSEEEHARRLEKLRSDPTTDWRVDEWDWGLRGRYRDYLANVEELVQQTDTGLAPWVVIEAHDRRWARIKAFATLVERLEGALSRHGLELPEPREDEQAEPPSDVAEPVGEGSGDDTVEG